MTKTTAHTAAVRPVHLILALGVLLAAGAAFGQADVTGPADVVGLAVDRDVDDAVLTWPAVTSDAVGNAEAVSAYRVYRGTTPDFVPDKDLGSNRIAEVATTDFRDVGAANAADDFYYLVSAVDGTGNEGNTKAPLVLTPPTLSGSWTDISIDLTWTDADPVGEVVSYRVYYGPGPGLYEFVDDVGLATSHMLQGIASNQNWYAAVVAVDGNGNESPFSNEHVDVIGGVITVRAHDEGELCWGASKCTPADPGHIQRSDGFQLLVPAEFPEGDWTSVEVTFTVESRLCDDPVAPDRCGDQNPGWNPCGDPWDRTAHLFLVLDDCIAQGGSCITHENLELLRTITPFGTDAPAPDGRGIVPPRALSFDVTPFAPLMTGEMYVGAHIGHFVPKGWWVTSDFRFSKRPEEASPKPPADGFDMVFFGGATPPTDTVSIPANATQVVTRLFTTGHGGSSFCDGGDNNGLSCEDSSQCPGGSCQNCDEFCHRENQILVDNVPVWSATPWRDCCWPRGSLFCEGCQDWNSCGYPSCTFDRAGWCPGEIACHYNLDEGCDQDLDQTANLPPGGTYDVDYHLPVRNGSWSISLALYWYE